MFPSRISALLGRATVFRMPSDRIAIYVTAKDPQLAANQRARMERYAEAMAWTVVSRVARDDRPALLTGASDHTFQRVVCWRIAEIDDVDELLAELERHGT